MITSSVTRPLSIVATNMAASTLNAGTNSVLPATINTPIVNNVPGPSTGFLNMASLGSITLCQDTSEAVELCRSKGLYLKPITRLNISVSLPDLTTDSACAVSNWEILEKLRTLAKPETFTQLKIVKSSLQMVKIEADLEAQNLLNKVRLQLDGRDMKISGLASCLKVQAAEAKIPYPTRHDWDSFFRDAKNMNELKAGERPDTVHLMFLPCKWFSQDQKSDKEVKPSEDVVKKVFEVFGPLRCIDIPMLDPINMYKCDGSAMPSSLFFDVYLQFTEYVGFARCMEALRNMKLMYFNEAKDEAFTIIMRVDFDRTKHLSDRSIRKRRLLRERVLELEQKKQQELEEERRKKEAEEIEAKKQLLLEQETLQKRRVEREMKRKEKAEQKKRHEEDKLMKQKIALEERKILIAMRKLETIRLLCELLRKAKFDREREDVRRREQELEAERRKQLQAEQQKKQIRLRQRLEADARKKVLLARQERELREKILTKVNQMESKEREALRRRLKKSKLKSSIVLENTREESR